MRQKKYQKIIKFIQLQSFDDVLKKYSHYVLFLLISLLIFFIFKDYIFLKKLYLFKDFGSDSINIAYPSYYSLANYLEKDGIPKWLFSQGMGQSVFLAGLSDPFSLLIILMGKNLVYYSIFFVELLKIFCAGFFFHLFLKKIKVSDYTALIGAILYSFSGFVILGGQWNVFSTQAVYVVLLLYSFEKLYQNNNWMLFPISIFLITSHQTLDLYLMGIFLLIYIIFRLFETNEKDLSKILSLFEKLVLLGVTGVAMSSLFFINSLHGMLESPRVTGDTSYFNLYFSRPIWGFEYDGALYYLTAFLRLFSCDILGTGTNFSGWWNYLEAPLFYCGLISLVLLPHFLSLPDKRKKIIYSCLFLFIILPIIFPFLRNAYWLFTGNYYRIYSLFVIIVILLIGLKSVDYIDFQSAINVKITIATILLLLVSLYYPYKNGQIINKNIRDTVAVFLILYSILVYLMKFGNIRNIVKCILLFVIALELIYSFNATVNKRPVISGTEISRKIGYNDYTVDALAFIKSRDKTFFRLNKDYSSGTSINKSMNDAKVQDFYGTSSYSSFNQPNYIKFLQMLEIINIKNEKEARWLPGLTKCPLLHSFASVKYALTKDQDPYLLRFGYDLIPKRFGDVQVLKNKFVLPLGFTYEKYIPLKDFKNLPQNQKMITLYKAVVIDDGIYNHFGHLTKFDLSNVSDDYWENGYAKDIEFLSRNSLDISKHGQNEITGNINLDKNKMLFFSIPFDKGWRVKIDGKSITPLMVNIGFIGVPVEKGFHHIELSFTPSYFYTGAAISFIAIIFFICLISLKYMRDKRISAT